MWQWTAIALPQWEYRGEAVVKGDGRVECISAASIIAKVVRDAEMKALDVTYPGLWLCRQQRLWHTAAPGGPGAHRRNADSPQDLCASARAVRAGPIWSF